MQIKIYIPAWVELADEAIPPLVRRVVQQAAEDAATLPATRGQLVRQAVLDGLASDLSHLILPDGGVDILVDPGGELPLVTAGKTISLAELAAMVADEAKSPRRDAAPMVDDLPKHKAG